VTSTLYRHGVIHSAADPFAEAVLVENATIAWIGSDDTADGLADNADEVVELAGALVAPGFVDAHTHVLRTALALEGTDLSPTGGTRSLADALAAVHGAAERARRGPSDALGQPLLGYGWDERSWPEDRAPRLDDLDRAGGGAPVLLTRVDGHSAVVSSSFADVAGLRSLVGWHADGWIEGSALDRASVVAGDVGAVRRDELYRTALRAAAAAGVVSLHEQSTPSGDTREGLGSLLRMTADPASGLPLVVGYRGEACVTSDDAREILAAVPGLSGIGGDLLVDGSLGSRSAALRAPYVDVRDDGDARGTLYLGAEQICNHITAVTRAGVQAGFHVIGDRAMDEFMLGLRAAVDVEGVAAIRGAGHRLEHAEMIDAPALAGLVLLGVHLSMQPAFDAAWGGPEGMYAARLGTGRAGALNPFADVAAAGIPIAFGSDSPVTRLDPWAAVRAAITHHQPDQRISARAAFRAHTRGGWRAAGLEHTGAGEIRVGASAHLAVWRAEHLAVQGSGTVSSRWSTDARAGTPLLPDLGPQAVPPVCVRTVRDGVVIHDELG
jgi:hypothetical protein